MSEEEIIHLINLCIENKGIPSEGIYWVKGLLDLYNKQKEEIEYYKDELELETSSWKKLEKAENLISKDKIKKLLQSEREDILNRVKEPNKRIYKLQVVDKLYGKILEE